MIRKSIWLFAALVPAWAGAAETALPKLGFGGQFRARAEASNIESYAAPGKRRGQDLLLFRSRLWASADPGHGLKAHMQLQDSRVSGSEASVAANTANLDLHQGYLDVLDLGGLPLDVRAGRQELSYGDQRLVSPLDWSNIGRAWDGARLKWRGPAYWADAFLTNIKEVNDARRDGHFWGLYASCAAVPRHEFDAYLLGRDNADGSYTSEHNKKGNLSDRTVGARVKGAAGSWDYTGEAVKQFGRKAGQVVRAWGAAAAGGYTFEAARKPRLGVEYDFASGDSDPSDNRVQTFDPLFPFGHALQGFQDIFSWKNGHDFKAGVSADAAPGWRAQLDLHHFRLAASRDAWYDAAAAQIARDATGASGKDVGSELDLTLKGKFRSVLGVYLGYSHFFAGRFVKNTTGARDRDWGFFQATLDF